MFADFFEVYGLKALFSFFFGIPVAIVSNAILSSVVNRLLRRQKGFLVSIAWPSLLTPLIIASSLTVYLVFGDYTNNNLFSAINYLEGLLNLSTMLFLVTTVPQLLTYAFLRERPSGMRHIVSIIIGCAIIILYAYIVWTVGRMIGATPD